MTWLTPVEAVQRIRPGRRVLIGSGAAEPASLVSAMVESAPHLTDMEVVHLMTLGPAPYVAPEHYHRFRHSAFFIGANVRSAVQEGRADFIPVFLSEVPRLIRERRVRIDVALVQVSTPDAHGYVSLGTSVDVVRAAVETAELVLAEVNPRMPRTHGDSFVHVSALQGLVRVDRPLPELSVPAIDSVSRAIGENVARLIPNGATLQVGIGKIPNAVLDALHNHVDLGLHTEMLSDAVRTLADGGVLNGRRKTLLPGKLVTSFVMGSRALYEWIDGHPAIEMRPSDFTNDPAVIARNDRMISVNSALAVDLTGQVAADSVDGTFFSGIGGQVDFIRGAARSRGGRPIIALPSTARGGRVSRIQATLSPGTGVVTSRGDVHYVVTEYGVADLWGKTVRERATALIAIAHPDFRAELLAEAKQRKYVQLDLPLTRANHPITEAQRARLADGREVVLRPAQLTDERAVQELFHRLSDQSSHQRFLGHKTSHPHDEVQQMVDLDDASNLALVAVGPGEELIGIARYDVDPATNLADVAFAVRDDWQGQGIGTLMMQRLTQVARARGLRGFTADVLTDNRPMRSIFRKSGLPTRSQRDDGVDHLELRFPEAAEA